MDEKYLIVKEKLKKYNQEQLLIGYEKLKDEDKDKFLNEILEINFDQINNLYKNIHKCNDDIEKNIEPIPYIEKDKMSSEEKNKYEKIGQDIIKNEEYAVITMAGGQRNKAWTQSDQKEHII